MKIWTLAAAGALLALPALAQTSSTTVEAAKAGNPAVATSSQMADKPASGANSFSVREALGRLQAHGFTNVTDLHKDTHGVWRGTATPASNTAMTSGNAMSGPGKTNAMATPTAAHTVSVWLDYKGNVGVQ